MAASGSGRAVPPLALASFAAAADNSTGSGNHVELFIDGSLSRRASYAALIVNACKDHAVYALQCTSVSGGIVGSNICGSAAPTLTVTEGANLYLFEYATTTNVAGHDAEMLIAASCNIRGTTAAECDYSLSASVDDTSTVIETSAAITGTDFHRYQVSITGGAEKIASATGSCDANANAAAGTSASAVKAMAAALAISLAGVVAL
ncbi:hypothetical protein C7999DRAFT_30338 [Corynascus novoguineensis]|uniref:Uncharacterized protein n=1 Tax=Corynascus novoguineensis TaxID=1126955 RepID=A0AAN7CXK9_9PEZI|nr:hypothetical protein C7999DRAFT_30338 [Corynascus novoguineensis]